MSLDLARLETLRTAPQVVQDALQRRGAAMPRFVVEGGARTVTIGEHASAIDRVAGFLIAEGLAPGDRAAIFAPNRLEWLTAAVGIQAAGGVMVPVYPSSTADQAAYVAEHSDAVFTFADTRPLLERIFERWSDYAGVRRIVTLDDRIDVPAAVEAVRARTGAAPSFAEVERKLVSWSRLEAIGADAVRARGEEIASRRESARLSDVGIMLYTSGTSGRPKGVPLSHLNLASNDRDWLQVFAPVLDEGSVDLLWLPMSHIFGYMQSYIGNLLGWTSHLVAPDRVLESLREIGPQVFMSVPRYWEKLAESAKGPGALREACGGRLSFCLSGGAGLKREIKEQFREAGMIIYEGYGLTETSPTLTLNRPGDFRFDSVGKPLKSVQLRLAGDGEILAKGPNVFSGYHKDPEATRGAFTAEGWFQTGDVGRFTEDGFLQIVDRKKDILVTAGGKNIPPANIEIRFKDDPAIEHCVVYGDGKRFIVAAVWPKAGASEAAVAQRIAKVNGDLASYESIKKFALVTDRPLTIEDGFFTPTMKLRRKRVYEAFREVFEGLYA